jgi:hypothetical protein
MGQLSQNSCPYYEEISKLKSDLDSNSRGISELCLTNIKSFHTDPSLLDKSILQTRTLPSHWCKLTSQLQGKSGPGD